MTAGETAFIARRRGSLTQSEMAKLNGVSRSTYARIEHDQIDHEPWPIDKLTVAEECVIMRRRANMTQSEVAAHLGVSRLWVNKMENEVVSCDRLIRYWTE